MKSRALQPCPLPVPISPGGGVCTRVCVHVCARMCVYDRERQREVELLGPFPHGGGKPFCSNLGQNLLFPLQG